jgi:hypothetical protein
MQIADPRVITGTKRKLIMKDAAFEGTVISLDALNSMALKYQVPQNAVRGLLVACGYKIPEPVVQPRTDQEPVKKPAAPPAAAKPPAVPPEVLAGILKGAIYKQLGEGDEAYVVTTKAAFLREREALRKIFKDGGLT